MTKIGIGVITAGNRQIHPNMERLSDPDALYHVHTDAERLGPGHARNAALRRLYDSGCTHMFVFDDDCYPVMAGWERYFVEQAEATGIGFFLMPEFFKDRIVGHAGAEVFMWDGGLVQFAMYTRPLLETVGGFNTAYDRYGFEDSAYIVRALRSGLAGPGAGYPSPLRTLAYIHSMDVYAENPTPNISAEDKQAYIRKNEPIYRDEINGGRLHYPF